jgi:hypothetical protein
VNMAKPPKLNATLDILTLIFVLACVSSTAAQNYMFGRADYAVGSAPQSVAVGDFNRDGRPDIVVANSSDSGAICSGRLSLGRSCG